MAQRSLSHTFLQFFFDFQLLLIKLVPINLFHLLCQLNLLLFHVCNVTWMPLFVMMVVRVFRMHVNQLSRRAHQNSLLSTLCRCESLKRIFSLLFDRLLKQFGRSMLHLLGDLHVLQTCDACVSCVHLGGGGSFVVESAFYPTWNLSWLRKVCTFRLICSHTLPMYLMPNDLMTCRVWLSE